MTIWPIAVAGLLVAVQPVRLPRAESGGLVAMPGGAVLAWTRRGDLQVRGPDGRWKAAQNAPVSFLESATVQADGTYVLGETLEQPSQRLTSHVFAVSSNGSLTEVIGPAKKRVEGQALLVPRRGLPPVSCSPGDASKATYRPPACHADSPAWEAAGSWTIPPFTCGDALVERGVRQVVARSPMDGHVLASARLEETAALACGDGRLLVGTNRITALDPTTLRPKWAVRVAGPPVTALCATPNEIVYFTPSGPRSVRRPVSGR